jgi:hypothetical protein
MTPDYDLSNLESAQVNLWLYLHLDDICSQIAAGRASRGLAPEAPSQGEPRNAFPKSLVFGRHKAESGNM